MTKFLSNNHLNGIKPKSVPCSQELAKQIENLEMPSTAEQLRTAHQIKPAYWKYAYLGWHDYSVQCGGEVDGESSSSALRVGHAHHRTHGVCMCA